MDEVEQVAKMHTTRVGVLGGGQLGQMLALAAQRLGVPVTILDPAGMDSPAGRVSGRAVCGSFTDPAKIAELAALVDVITVEIEHVDAEALARVGASCDVKIHPSPATIALIQDKLLQKQHLLKAAAARQESIPMGDFCETADVEAVLSAGERWGYPLMLKARKGAYDGRGNAVVASASDASSAFSSLSAGGVVQLYAERWCPFSKELAVMVVRDVHGRTAAYPTVETVQRDSMCHTVVAPANVSAAMRAEAMRVASAAIATMEGAGIFGVELFAMPDGAVLLNEIAPRPHNSGHYTMDACHVSQFENHLRAVVQLPLGSCEMKVGAAAMLNVIGAADGTIEATLQPIARAIRLREASVHWYGKSPPKPKRKMGHINVTGSDGKRVAQLLEALEGSSDPAARSPIVGVIMGSDSDLPTMRAAAEVLTEFDVPFELTIVSAHRTPQRLYEYAASAEDRGIRTIIAGAGGAAHLPGMVAAITPLPVIGVPVKTSTLSGNDSLLSIVQMPRGVPVATVAIGNAANAGLLAVRMLGMADVQLRQKMQDFMRRQETEVLQKATKLEQGGWESYQS
ncbi:hypothetical protein AB1Y20_005182 [Prymnesium parvum]|uniref:phosphoribosylaminoimidazole carboxylase n=1 Tax=Prymnesium parvum TaxID=97485 RepID=A0AB34J549_PRYPA|mmetsp:Transcript_31491/g.72052  ORF Transcript_31491/g.72052 Transcript_31491/m.72052 type:complete len:570 (-) Transcript_31491:560-2269(-)